MCQFRVRAQNQIVGSNRVSLDAMVAACDRAVIVDDALVGDVADAAGEDFWRRCGPRVATAR